MSNKKSKLARKTVGKIVKSQHYTIMQSYMDTFCRQDFNYRLSMAWSLLRRRHPFRVGKVEIEKKVKQRAEDCRFHTFKYDDSCSWLECKKGNIKKCKKCKMFLSKEIDKNGEES